MSVTQYLKEKLKKGTVHITLIDPMKQSPDAAARLALTAQEVGSDLILVTGLNGLSQRNLLETTRAIKEKISIPLVYSPAGGEALCFSFDAFFFGSLLNAKNPYYFCGGQAQAAIILKRMEVETIPVGYIAVEPGMKVGDAANVDLISRDNYWMATNYAVAAELFGMGYVYFESGVNAAQPIPAGMIRAVKKELSVPLIVGGGIRTAVDARRVRQAGADMVVTGTIIENAGYRERLRSILSALKD
ncbi:MAG TPA: phosphoglycerol geranylgeranyltransferase [Firmicutes bacterium]|jgi:phosphoglycerol geranylgeranyltransferase|nr:phosphoglycerol geranylgeranyltransferase [Bacillota bacterium]HAA34698.1 phosphoglycerol geranylgeranyltransferase [Bacillota bacterium]